MTDIFERLESNNREAIENAKETLREQFMKVNDPWLLNGLYDYYLNTNSVRSMDILVNIREPHHQYLFDRLSESIKSSKTEIKVQALTLLGHVARSQPTWLYKLQEHNLLRDILQFLKNEMELLPLISALLLLIVLLPMIPSAMGHYLRDIFDIFRLRNDECWVKFLRDFCNFNRLASWNCGSGKFVEEQNVHMQVALYALFLRLYGMYPCNFLAYLQAQYKEKNNPVFVHTIKPMLDTVRMHPSLVTASKENEITTERWKKKGVHDVIVECERFSLDITDRCPHDSCQNTSGFRSRSGTTNSNIEPSYHQHNLKSLATFQMQSAEGSYFSPGVVFHVQTPPITETVPTNIPHVQGVIQGANYLSQEGTSPPEAAIEATPETTPVRDFRLTAARSQPINSNIARALTSFSKNRSSGSQNTTPTHSQPSSPMRKEISPFTFTSESKSAFRKIKRESVSNQKLNKLILERSQISESSGSIDTITKNKNLPTPSSPLRIISSEAASRQFIQHQRIESPISQEDEEVLSIVGKNEAVKPSAAKPCGAVLPDLDDCSNENLEEEQEHGSPCTAGGLHMPNSKSMNSFAKRVQRLRYHSQCNPEPERIETSTGSSPGNSIPFPNSTTVRRANSCPEMKKSPVNPTKDNMSKPLDETDEETVGEVSVESVLNDVNSFNQMDRCEKLRKTAFCCSTQTENFWPMPYEHLFLGIFPSLESNEVKPSPAPSPAPFNISQERSFPPSLYDILDKYIESAVNCSERNSSQLLRDQLQLLHQQLLFERHRRETHAYRNRRLLSDAKSTRLLEECNSALRDTVQLQQKDIDELRKQIGAFKTERLEEDKKLNKTIQYWENQCKILQLECKNLREANDVLTKDLTDLKTKCAALDEERQKAESVLLDTIAEVNVAREQAWVGEKGRHELEQVNKELLLIGELQLKYQEKMDRLSAMKRSDEELEHVKESYRDGIKSMEQQLEVKATGLDAFRARVHELEHIIVGKEDLLLSQKKMVNMLSEQRFEKLEAVESKYQTQLTINRALEEKILDLRQRLDSDKGKRCVHSPDTSSCHEVNVTTTAGFSPHSSPLSASLASSEGSMAFHEREVKNLQAIVDQKESKSRFDEPGEAYTENDGQQTSSSKND